MPIMDGFQVLIHFIILSKATQELIAKMELKQLPSIPIVGHSAFSSKKQMNACLEVGMSDYSKIIFIINLICSLVKKPTKKIDLERIFKKYHLI